MSNFKGFIMLSVRFYFAYPVKYYSICLKPILIRQIFETIIN